MRVNLLWIGVSAVVVSSVFAHEGEHEHVDEVDLAKSQVTIREEGESRIIEANGLPDHKTGRFPNRGNPNSIDEQRYRFRMPLKPQANEKPRPVERWLFGVAVNGVVFDPGAAEVWVPGQRIATRPGPGTRLEPGEDRSRAWNYEAMGTMRLGIDDNHAHVQPNGAYHYHGAPTALVERLRNKQDKAQMLLIGYAADGFPIYADRGHEQADDAKSPLKTLQSSYQMKKGKRPTGDDGPGGEYDGTFVQDYEYVAESGDLDECNGRTGVTPEYPEGTYYYVATETFPFVPRQFRGTPDESFQKRMGRPGGRGRGPGGPPFGRRGRRGPPRDGEGPQPQRPE